MTPKQKAKAEAEKLQQRIQYINDQGTLYLQDRLVQLTEAHGLTEAQALTIMDAEPRGYRAVEDAWAAIGKESPTRINRDLKGGA